MVVSSEFCLYLRFKEYEAIDEELNLKVFMFCNFDILNIFLILLVCCGYEIAGLCVFFISQIRDRLYFFACLCRLQNSRQKLKKHVASMLGCF